jgi:hypothetical protein
MHMQDQEVVAAIVAGAPDGLAEMYDRYAAPLYAYCSFMLPGPDAAADVVRDTFLIATSRLEGLRDPGKLDSWLHAVARSECLRRRSAAGVTSPPPTMPRPASGDDAWPAVELPPGLRWQVLKACTDSTPAGRADRVSTAHRAGVFGAAGFPKAPGSPGPPWRRQPRRRPGAAAVVATVAAVGVTAGIIAMLMVGGSHRAQASTLANGGGVFGGSPGAAGGASASPSPGDQASPATGHPTPSGTVLKGAISPGSSTRHGTPQASASASGTSSSPTSASPTPTASPTPSPSPSASRSPSASPSASPSPSPSPSRSPSASPTPTQGTLKVAPDTLSLTSTSGKAASGKFVLSASGGPVSDYAIKVPAGQSGKMTVTPATGSLAKGGSVTVTVTVTSTTALNTSVTVDPGGITVTVVLAIKA